MAPRYSFRDPVGIERTVVSEVSSYPARYFVGQSVRVLFNADSGESKLESWFELRGAETICFALFSLFFLVGLVGIAVLIS
jgi:hypothetical protein